MDNTYTSVVTIYYTNALSTNLLYEWVIIKYYKVYCDMRYRYYTNLP